VIIDAAGPGKPALGPYARALCDYFDGDSSVALRLHSSLGEHDDLPMSLFFRGPRSFFGFESVALEHCRGRVLDAGAGTGVHALELQKRGFEVTAIDITREAVEIMGKRGVADARHADMFTLGGNERFDTILMMMNGTGPMETLDGLDRFLDRGHRLLKPGGRVVLDSSEVQPQDPPKDAPHIEWPDEPSAYVGESWIVLEYGGEMGAPFRELYVDHATLEGHAHRAGWRCDVVFLDENGAFTAVLTPPRR
jgi:SAM-dependent methyltransferase